VKSIRVYIVHLVGEGRKFGGRRLFRVVLEESDQVVPVLVLLETTESHLGSRDVLLGVLEVLEQGLVIPCDTLLLVCVGVGVALDLTGLTTEETVQVGTSLVGTALLEGVALSASSLEEVGTLRFVSFSETHYGL